MDASKDRLYSDAAGSLSRRSAQTVLAENLKALVRVVAPILVFTSEEVWQFMPEALRDGAESVHLSGWPELDLPAGEADALRESYRVIFEVRDVATKALEDARNESRVGKSQEAILTLTAPPDVLSILDARGVVALADLLIVAEVVLEPGEDLVADVSPATGDKCPRCWNFREIGTDVSYPDVCERCASVLAGPGD